MGSTVTSGRPAVVLGFNRGALGLARGLGRAGLPVIGVGFDPYVAYSSRFYAERLLVAPRPVRGRTGLLQALEQIAQRGRPVVFPATEGTVGWLADNWDSVRYLADMPLPDDIDVVHRLRRKDLLPAAAEQAGVPAPRTMRPSSADELRAAGLRPPVLIKPIEGKRFAAILGEKLYQADTIEEAVELWERARSGRFETIVQELVPGHEGNIYSFFGYLDRELRPLAAVVGRKERDAPRPFGSSAVFRAGWNERVYERAVALLRSAGYRGLVHVELGYDARIDDFVLIEVNTRVPTWAGIAMTRDFNVAKIAYLDLCGEAPEPIRLERPRLWVDLAEDLAAGGPDGPTKIVSFARPYLARHSIGALFAPDDPAPGVREALRLLKEKTRLRSRLKTGVRRFLPAGSASE